MSTLDQLIAAARASQDDLQRWHDDHEPIVPSLGANGNYLESVREPCRGCTTCRQVLPALRRAISIATKEAQSVHSA